MVGHQLSERQNSSVDMHQTESIQSDPVTRQHQPKFWFLPMWYEHQHFHAKSQGSPGCLIKKTYDTLPETKSLHLKMDGWKMSFLLGRPPARCELLVFGSVFVFFWPHLTFCFFSVDASEKRYLGPKTPCLCDFSWHFCDSSILLRHFFCL